MSDWTVDSTSATPVYQQIVEQIRFLVEGGSLKPGERLPPVREFATSLGVNRNTVAKAYAMLRALGLIETRGASGTRVAAPGGPGPSAPGAARAGAGSALRDAVWDAVRAGLSPEEVRDTAFAFAIQAVAEAPSASYAEGATHSKARARSPGRVAGQHYERLRNPRITRRPGEALRLSRDRA